MRKYNQQPRNLKKNLKKPLRSIKWKTWKKWTNHLKGTTFQD